MMIPKIPSRREPLKDSPIPPRIEGDNNDMDLLMHSNHETENDDENDNDNDNDHDHDNDDNTSRTTNTKSTSKSHHRTANLKPGNSSHMDSSNSQNNRNSHRTSSSHFEINCSPLPVSRAANSYYEETRMRRKQQKLNQQKHQQLKEQEPIKVQHEKQERDETLKTENRPLHLATNHHDNGVNSQTVEELNDTDHIQPDIIPNDDDDDDDDNNTNKDKNESTQENDDDDANSCCTLVDSGMSFHGDFDQTTNDPIPIPKNTAASIDSDDIDDCTISTSKMGSTTIDTSSNTSTNQTSVAESQTIQNSSLQRDEAVSTSSYSTLRSVCSSVSRGEEHISTRMKKYGLYNLHEMKRKLQQRRVNRNGNNASNATNPTTSATSNTANNHPRKIQESVSVNSGLTEGMTESSGPGLSSHPNAPDRFNAGSSSVVGVPTKIRTAPLHVQMAVEEIHRWLFTEGGHFEDVQTLMTQYSLYVREHFGIPLDRLYYGGVGLHPKLTAYLWKWEAHGEFTHSEMPPHIFARRNEIFSPDEPFCVLEQGRADHVRIRHTDDYIPPDTAKWFRGCNYKDYFALPDIHRGVSKGGLAWSTKSADGFCDDDIQFFRMTHAALTTIMRLHTNDLVLNTLTDRMEAEIEDRTNELAIANAKLEAANEEISKHASKQLEHFACMSHEIRTPLNCIVGLSSLLLENEDLTDNDDLLETINMVYNSADLVQGVVNDVLDYAKIESGHFELDVKPSDLQTTLNGVVHSISNKLVDKNVEVRTSYSGLLGKTMTTDSRRLQQILYNILGNAAKFSREGTTIDFKVRVLLAADKPKEGEKPKHIIRFSIKDYGKGIEEKNFEKIFQPFSQASKETQTIYGGTGLGLSITKNLVARLGGTISIRSEIDKFTEFIVELPYEHEQLANVAHHREKLFETSIVILDPNSNDIGEDEDDSFLPFPKSVCEQYGLSVLRCSSWGELESKLGLRANIRQNYYVLAHEDIEERQGMLNVEKLVRRERCAWFSFGSEGNAVIQGGPIRKHHFKTLTGVFPSALLGSMTEHAATQRESLTSGSSSVDSSFSSLEESKSLSGSIGEESGGEGSQQRSLSPPTTTPMPFETPNESNGGNESRPESTTRSKKKFATKYPPRALKVLIVDDNVINQKVLDRILKRLGVTDISIVDNGKKAVDITASNRYDCIFMDMEMPVMGGLEACKIIVDRDKEAARVAFVTAHDISDIREKADEAGAFGYISKPLKMKDIHEFLAVLEDLNKKDPPTQPLSTTTTTANTTKSASTKGDSISSGGTAKKRSTPPKKKTRSTKQYPPRAIKVLVAEDNLINQKVLDRILKRVGVTDITIVDNGKKAVDASAQTKFDCILMDMQMPIMDGLEACKIIVKRDQDKEDCPKIVFVTAHALVEFREKALAAGAFDFITKPFKMEDIDKVLTILEGTKSNSESSPKPPGGENNVLDAANTDMCTSSTSSEESNSNAKPTKMPKLIHSLGE